MLRPSDIDHWIDRADRWLSEESHLGLPRILWLFLSFVAIIASAVAVISNML